MVIAHNGPHVILLTETIPKAQVLPISAALLNMPGLGILYANFDPGEKNLGTGVSRHMYLCERYYSCSASAL